MAPPKGKVFRCPKSYRLRVGPEDIWWKAQNAREAVQSYRLAFPDAAPITAVFSMGGIELREKVWR
jgi:hypothetical protein